MRMGFGCVSLGTASGGRSSREEERLVAEAVDAGVVVFDTADAYGNGESERVLGRALRAHRDDVVIATKGGYLFHERSSHAQSARRATKRLIRAVRPPGGRSHSIAVAPGGNRYGVQDFSAGYLRSAVEASLRRLQTDHVDVFQLHGPGDRQPALFAEMHDLITAGMVGRFGVGAGDAAVAAGWLPVAGVEVVQLPFGVLDPGAADDVFPEARRRGVEIWARGVLGGGLLAAAAQGGGNVRAHPKWPLIEGLQRVAARSGIDVYGLALGFVNAHSRDIATLLVGVGSSEHLHANLRWMDSPPLPADVLDGIWRLLR